MARLELDIEMEDAHVRGTLRPEGGQDVTFVGWLSLLALLEQALGLPAAS
jgi:hypothetical protein